MYLLSLSGVLGSLSANLTLSMEAEFGDRRRFCELEKRSVHDAEEQLRFSVSLGLRKWCGFRPVGAARSPAARYAGRDRRASRRRKSQGLANDIGPPQRLLGQLAVCLQNHRDGLLEIRTRFV